MQNDQREQFTHPYFESIVAVKDNMVIGKPSELFWEAWRNAKSHRRDGAMMRFRSELGMFKANPKDEQMMVEKAMHVLSPRIADWKPTNRKQKDEEENMTWFICTMIDE